MDLHIIAEITNAATNGRRRYEGNVEKWKAVVLNGKKLLLKQQKINLNCL